MSNNKPYIKIKIFNDLSLVFWENEISKQDKKFKVLNPYLTRSIYNPDKKEWSNQAIPISFNALYRLISMGTKIKAIEDNYKEEIKVAKPEKVEEEIVE